MPGPLDQNYWAPPKRGREDVFLPSAGAANCYTDIWHKPRGCTFLSFTVIGGGGGGGGGLTRASGAAGGGGAGGACSGISRFFVPAFFVPDTLYLLVGRGGQGGTFGAPASAGTAGLNSYISTAPFQATPASPNLFLYSGVNAPGGGANGTAAGGAVGGTVPTISVVQPWNLYGIWQTNVGVVGGAGGALGAGGANTNAFNLTPLSSGSGAGSMAAAGPPSVQQNGGTVVFAAALSIPSQNPAPNASNAAAVAGQGGNTAANAGNAGFNQLNPFFVSGGSGGGSADAGVAGDGGQGGYGCGGGGGGSGQTGGRGGNGGDGLIIIDSI